jgi:hypothetical protein
MLRVIRSTVQGVDIDSDLEDAYEKAIDQALAARDEERETVGLDELGQKADRIALLPYTDPTGAHRWAILDDGPSESDWQDTDDLDEAIATYEEWVRGATEGAMPEYDDEGNQKPIWDESDVEGVSTATEYDGSSNIDRARMLAAQWAHEEFLAAEQSYQEATRRRQASFAKAIDSWGRGGQAVLAKRVDLKEPTVKTLADKGRQVLAAQTAEVEA